MSNEELKKKPILIEKFADNGEHSHWQLCNENGEVLWSEENCLQKQDEVLGHNNPWPLVDVLRKLTEASDTLLNRYNYDGHSHEEISICIERGKEIIKLLESPISK